MVAGALPTAASTSKLVGSLRGRENRLSRAPLPPDRGAVSDIRLSGRCSDLSGMKVQRMSVLRVQDDTFKGLIYAPNLSAS